MPDKMDVEGDRKSVPFWQGPKKKVLARLNTSLFCFFQSPGWFPLRRAQRPCYENLPVPVTELGPVPVTLHRYGQSVPVTSNPHETQRSTLNCRIFVARGLQIKAHTIIS